MHDQRASTPVGANQNSVKAPDEGLFLFISEKDTESNRGVSAPAGEKAPGMAPSANEDGPAGVHDMHPKKVTVLKVTGVELVTLSYF